MANFYTEHPELRYHLNNPMMERICELKERNYRLCPAGLCGCNGLL